MIDEYIKMTGALMDQMEKSYEEVAAHYGFGCEGCTDNCCTQRFHHHTLSEYLYLKEGIKKADPEVAGEILRRALLVVDSYHREVEAGQILPVMCPVNLEGSCLLYAHRPMICRLHGLPHRFTRPDATEGRGGGCRRFEEGHQAERLLDRTWAYTELAHLERELRMRTNFQQRMKLTTAEMLANMLSDDPQISTLVRGC